MKPRVVPQLRLVLLAAALGAAAAVFGGDRMGDLSRVGAVAGTGIAGRAGSPSAGRRTRSGPEPRLHLCR